MFNWVYEIATGQFIFGGPCEVTPGAGQAAVKLPRNPKPRTERYDGAGGIRAATAQEITNYDTAQANEQSLSRFDGEKLVKALAIWTAGKVGVPINTAKQEIFTIYKTL
jgi:hypothetical protein